MSNAFASWDLKAKIKKEIEERVKNEYENSYTFWVDIQTQETQRDLRKKALSQSLWLFKSSWANVADKSYLAFLTLYENFQFFKNDWEQFTSWLYLDNQIIHYSLPLETKEIKEWEMFIQSQLLSSNWDQFQIFYNFSQRKYNSTFPYIGLAYLLPEFHIILGLDTPVMLTDREKFGELKKNLKYSKIIFIHISSQVVINYPEKHLGFGDFFIPKNKKEEIIEALLMKKDFKEVWLENSLPEGEFLLYGMKGGSELFFGEYYLLTKKEETRFKLLALLSWLAIIGGSYGVYRISKKFMGLM